MKFVFRVAALTSCLSPYTNSTGHLLPSSAYEREGEVGGLNPAGKGLPHRLGAGDGCGGRGGGAELTCLGSACGLRAAFLSLQFIHSANIFLSIYFGPSAVLGTADEGASKASSLSSQSLCRDLKFNRQCGLR